MIYKNMVNNLNDYCKPLLTNIHSVKLIRIGQTLSERERELKTYTSIHIRLTYRMCLKVCVLFTSICIYCWTIEKKTE